MTNSASVIQGYYNSILDRTGSADEVGGWANLVDNDGVPLLQVQVAFANSFEALTYVAPIIQMYQAHLGRVPEQAGLAAWVAVLESGSRTLAQIGILIASSPESQTYYGTAFDANFVTSLYERILGREPESGAVSVWLAAKANGMTQAQMQEVFRASTEAQTRAGPAVTNFLASVASGNSNAYIGSLYASGQIFVLTTGQNSGATFTGTTGNDTFRATEDTTGSPVPTWTTADAIDGGTGLDTFNVTQTAAISGAPLNASVTNVENVNIVDGSSVTLNTTGWTGLAALNVTDVGATVLTVSGPTGATVTDTAGAVTVTGGSTQTVTTSAGAVALSGAGGAIALTDSTFGSSAVTVNGGSSVNVAVTGETTGFITVGGTTAPTGAVTVTASTSPTATASTVMGTISVTGGSTVNITQNALGAPHTGTITTGTVNVQGTAATTSVSVTATPIAFSAVGVTGVSENNVSISDVNAGGSSTAAGTITSISVRNYTTLSIQDNALTTLSLAGGSGNIIVDNSNTGAPANTTLNLTLDGQTGGTLDDADLYTTLNVTTTGTNSTLANNTFGAETALNVSGTKKLTLTSTAGLTVLGTVTVSGAAGLAADLSGNSMTAIDTSATTGASTVTMNGGRATFNGGAGSDTVTVANALTKAISLGDGDDSVTIGALVPTAAISGGAGTDTLSMDSTSAAIASGSGAFANIVTGFEKLVLTGATNQTVDLAVLGIPNAVTTSGGNGLTLSNLNNGGTLTLKGAGTAYTIGNSAFSAGVNDTVNLVLTDSSGAGVAYAATGITASNVENIAITTVDGQATPSGSFNDSVTLLGNSSQTITVRGNAGLTLTATSTRLTSVDASGITLGGFTYTTGALAAAASIKGSATGTNTVDFSAATQAVTYTGGSGNDTITASNSRNDVIDLGNGTNSLVGTSGNLTITGGTGSDTIVVGGGNNTISTGDGSDSVTVTNGVNTITTGSGADTITVGSGSNAITLGAHGASTADSIRVGATAAGSYIPTAFITGLNTVGLDTIAFVGDNLANAFTVFTPTQVSGFGDALGTSNPPTTLQMAVADVLGSLGGNLAQHKIGAFQFGGANYLVEQANTAGTAFGAGDTLIKLAGTPTFNTTSVSGGVLHLLS